MSRGYNSAISKDDAERKFEVVFWAVLKVVILLLSGTFFGILFGFGLVNFAEPNSVVLESIRNYLTF